MHNGNPAEGLILENAKDKLKGGEPLTKVEAEILKSDGWAVTEFEKLRWKSQRQHLPNKQYVFMARLYDFLKGVYPLSDE